MIDALGREWQCTTIQFDFNLPERFDVSYIGEDGREHRPYMVHRALLGSMERFFGVLVEHYAGAFPLWLAPVQAVVIPIADRHSSYANSVASQLREAGLLGKLLLLSIEYPVDVIVQRFFGKVSLDGLHRVYQHNGILRHPLNLG